MKKSEMVRYRIKLTEYELRVMINALNAVNQIYFPKKIAAFVLPCVRGITFYVIPCPNLYGICHRVLCGTQR
ncbi:MAG: hypothetical protein DBY04_02945 [Clostridiales bacterium]|nr:MAG: hypothetical protein DBY04_02945 [Clostridiales bacterium]